MINIKFAVLTLTDLSSVFDKDISKDIIELISLISKYTKENDQQDRLLALIDAERLNQKIKLTLDAKWSWGSKKFNELKEVIHQLEEYFEAKYRMHLKVKGILSRVALKEILLATLRAKTDYGLQPDLGLGREPYIPPKESNLKLEKLPVLKKDEFGRVEGGLDDRRVLDGRGLAITLRHQIEKYDPKHRPWRNFLYRDYNETFDFWKKNIRNVELHLIYPEDEDSIQIIEKKWKQKDSTYRRDILFMYYPKEKCWRCFIRDEKEEQGYNLFVIEPTSPLMAELSLITAKNSRIYDKRKLEELILEKQPFIKKTKKGTEGYLLSRDHANFYQWIEKNSKLNNSNSVIYFNDLESTQYLVKVNDKNQLVYLGDKQPITTKVAEGKRKSDEYIYVMDLEGNFYIAKSGDFDPNKPGLRIQHPSFKNGQRTLAAGTIRVTDGKVTYINNGSGHYLPGEFSLFKVVMELDKAGVLDEKCKVEFVTMNKEDLRYKKKIDEDTFENELSAKDFIERGKKEFLKIINDKTLEKYSYALSIYNKKEEKTNISDDLFSILWKITKIAKISFKTSGGYKARVTHFLDKVNDFIREVGGSTNEKERMANPTEFHELRAVWHNFLFLLLGGAKGEYISCEHLVSSIQKFVGINETSLVHKELNKKFKSLLDEIAILKEKNIEYRIPSKQVKDYIAMYQAQIQYANSKLLTSKQDPYRETELKKLSTYKLFTLTSNMSSTALVPVEEMVRIETQNLSGVSKKS